MDQKLSRRGYLKGLTAAGIGAMLLPSQPSFVRAKEQDENVDLQENVEAEMRDGRVLATDVYQPSGAGQGDSFPTLVIRTPYNKEVYDGVGNFFAQEDYAVVVQDVRGKFASEGTFYPYRSEGNAEAQDGYDTVEWAAEQSWSNGRVGTMGISYLAGTQWAIAHNDELPPSLEAMTPGYAVSSYYGQGAYSGGACLLSHNIDYLNGFAIERYRREDPDMEEDFSAADVQELTPFGRAQEAMMQLYWDLPVDPYEPMEQAGYEWLADWHGNETYDEYWQAQDHARHYDKVDIPVLNFGGWYDIFTQGTVQNYQGLREEGNEHSELVMGPYTHGRNNQRAQGQVTGHAYRFPENVAYDDAELLLRWFDRHLKQDEVASEVPAPVRLYVPGMGEWVGVSDIPLPDTEFRNYYLHSDGNANASAIDESDPGYSGRLSTEQPGEGTPDKYTYDPSDPVISEGGYNTHWNGAVSDRATAYHDREDILVYQTEILEEPVAVIGPITMTLYASTTGPDTDFVVTLSDVNPTGRTGGLRVAEGARRGRIGDVEADPRDLETYSTVQLLEPEQVYGWEIAIWPTARVFQEGHRIRIDITSSDFPRYDRNLNTGEGLQGTEMQTADQTVYHDQERPSNVELPVVPMANLENNVIDEPIPGP